MLALARGEQIDLPPSGRERTRILALHAEQDQLGHVAKVESDAAAIRAAVLADLVPDDVGFVGEAPGFHDRQTFRQQRIGTPEIEMRLCCRNLPDWELLDLLERQRAIAR